MIGQKREKTLLVMAAGMGSRFGGLKQLTPVGPAGECILEYSMYDAFRYGFTKVVLMIRKENQHLFEAAFADKMKPYGKIAYAYQEKEDVPEGTDKDVLSSDREKPWGTGQAVYAARHEISGTFMVINADDFYGAETFEKMSIILDTLDEKQGALIAYELKKTMSRFGSVSRGLVTAREDGMLLHVREIKDLSYEGEEIRSQEWADLKVLPSQPVSMNVWGFHPTIFSQLEKEFAAFLRTSGQEMKKEFLLPEAVQALVDGKELEVLVRESKETWLGMTYQEDKAYVAEGLLEKIRKGQYPEKLWEEI